MVLHLAEQLEVPLRERNPLLLAAGYAPVYAERALDEPAMAPVREALDLVLQRPRALPGASSSTATGTWSRPTAPSGLLTGRRRPSLLAPPRQRPAR